MRSIKLFLLVNGEFLTCDLIIFLFYFFKEGNYPVMPVGPVIEPASPEAFISESPLEIIKKKGTADIPTLISFVADEGLIISAGISILF